MCRFLCLRICRARGQTSTRLSGESFTTPRWCLLTPGCQIWSPIVARFLDISGHMVVKFFVDFRVFGFPRFGDIFRPPSRGIINDTQAMFCTFASKFWVLFVGTFLGISCPHGGRILAPHRESTVSTASRGNHGWRFTARIQVVLKHLATFQASRMRVHV